MSIQKIGELLGLYEKKEIVIGELSSLLELSKRQTYRLIKRYRQEGVLGLFHKGREKPSNNKSSAEKKAEILSLVRLKYYDCGASYASELLLANEGVAVNRETLRLWMREAGLLIRRRKRKPYRQRRDRKGMFGELLQIDGSFEYWFGRDKPKACLINLIDDATSFNICCFDEEETIRAATLLLWQWIKQWGIPKAIYADRRNAYINNDLLPSDNFFGNLCKTLNIRTIAAFSPQAKGRVERSNRTHQERLVPQLRLNNITTITTANEYLKDHYLPAHNKKFALPIEMLIENCPIMP